MVVPAIFVIGIVYLPCHYPLRCILCKASVQAEPTILGGTKMGNEVKVGVEMGAGPPPGYRWSVLILSMAFDEVMGFCNDDQYQHLAMQVKDLASQDDPTHPVGLSVDAVEDFHELRDRGGILGGMNVRIFFCLDKRQLNNRPDAIVILGGIKKQNNGPTPLGDKRRMARRKRKYFNGDYGGP